MEAQYLQNNENRRFKNIRVAYDMEISTVGVNSLSIGNNPRSDIYLSENTDCYFQITINRTESGFEASSDSADFKFYINGALADEAVNSFKVGSFLTIGDVSLFFEEYVIRTSMAFKIKTQFSFKDLSESGKAMVYPEFYRNARYMFELPDEKLEVLNPETPPQEPKRNLLMTLTPILVTLLLMIFIRSRMMRGGVLYIVYFASTMLVGAAMSVWTFFDNGKDYRKKTKERIKKYAEYIEKKEVEIQENRAEEKLIMTKRNPSIEDTVDRILSFSPNLFEKQKGHEDYLDVRIGTGSVKSQLQIEYRKQEYLHVYDELIDYPEFLHDKYEYITDMPVTLPLGKVNAVGFVGNRTKLYHMMKNMVLTIAGQESFTDVKMMFLLDDVYAPYLEWVRWLPNTFDESTGMRNVMYDEESSRSVLGNLYSEIASREGLKKEQIDLLPDYIVFAFRSERLSDHPVSKYFEVARNLGFTFLFFEEKEEFLHKACDLGVFLDDNDFSGFIQDLSDGTEVQSFTYTHVSKEVAEQCSKKLAPIYIKEPTLESDLRKNISLYELLDVKKVEDISLSDRWNASKVYSSMAAPLGVKTGGEVVYLDIHEKYHGPHGLVAGTTGSGKSEILQTYILSMATLFHPYEVSFIIIDFKGGGMANQFKQLPHLNGAITNIDGKQINRSLMSIKAELIKRQELFAQYDVNRIDDYIKLYKDGITPTPLPHLILIVDEFAELKSEQPEFMKELISAARIGRSLGVHLILATQKPAGVVNDQIWSNSKFKLCLKVQDKTDSNEVLKSPLAAEIREPGRAYLQVGNNEIFELFQSAYSGAYVSEGNVKAVTKFSISQIDLAGRRSIVYSQAPEKNDNTITELNAIVEYIDTYCKEEHIAKLQEICLPPLAEIIEYPDGISRAEESDVIVPIGMYDDPARQQQKQLTMNFTQSHLFILGASLAGKTYLVQNMIYGLAKNYSPEEVNIYIMDFASMVLKGFARLNHVGAVVSLAEDEKLKNFVEMIQKKIEERREILSTAGLSSFGAYKEAGNSDLPQIVIFLENYTAFRETYPDIEAQFLKVCRDGVALGISVVVTNQQMSGIGFKLLTNFSTKIAMNCNERNQYSELLDRCRTQPDEFPGRGLIKIDSEIMEFQTYLTFSNGREVERLSKITEFIDECNQKYGGKAAEAVKFIPPVLNDEYMVSRFGTTEVENYNMLVGLAYSNVEPVYNDIATNHVTGIYGRDELGREIYVKYLIRKAMLDSDACPMEVSVVDDSSGPLGKFCESIGVKRYTDNAMELVDVMDYIHSVAVRRYELLQNKDELTDEPLLLVVFNDSKIAEKMDENESLKKKYNEIVNLYSNCKISFIFANLPNIILSADSSSIYLDVRNRGNMLFFEDLGNIKIINVPTQFIRQLKKPNGKGDAFYTKDGKLIRLKAME